jgi:hypothetical protein
MATRVEPGEKTVTYIVRTKGGWLCKSGHVHRMETTADECDAKKVRSSTLALGKYDKQRVHAEMFEAVLRGESLRVTGERFGKRNPISYIDRARERAEQYAQRRYGISYKKIDRNGRTLTEMRAHADWWIAMTREWLDERLKQHLELKALYEKEDV